MGNVGHTLGECMKRLTIVLGALAFSFCFIAAGCAGLEEAKKDWRGDNMKMRYESNFDDLNQGGSMNPFK
jgi:hypothetical protein